MPNSKLVSTIPSPNEFGSVIRVEVYCHHVCEPSVYSLKPPACFLTRLIVGLLPSCAPSVCPFHSAAELSEDSSEERPACQHAARRFTQQPGLDLM